MDAPRACSSNLLRSGIAAIHCSTRYNQCKARTGCIRKTLLHLYGIWRLLDPNWTQVFQIDVLSPKGLLMSYKVRPKTGPRGLTIDRLWTSTLTGSAKVTSILVARGTRFSHVWFALFLVGVFAFWNLSSWPVRLEYAGDGSYGGDAIPLAELVHFRQGTVGDGGR